MALASFMLAAIALGGTASEPIVVGEQKQLFLDDYLIESMEGVERRVQTASKHPRNPVLWKTEPWESDVNILYGSVLLDNGKFRMWYMAGEGVGYAESDDGITWRKPRFDLVLDNGRPTNRLFVKRDKFLGPEHLPTFWEVFGVFKDERETDPARRYKMGFLSIIRPYSGPRPDPFHPTDRRGLGVAGSPDGIHWTLIDPFATEAICDGATHWMVDPASGNYLLYGRTKKTLPEVESAWSAYDWYDEWHSGRAVARVESRDFLKWDYTDPATAPVVLTADIQDMPGTEIYSMHVFPYEGIYIGLVQTYLARPDASWLDVQLAVSRDSVHFTRVGDRSPFIPLGPVGSWDRFNHSLANNPPIEVGDELRFYYGGRTYRHTPYAGPDKGPRRGGIGVASIKRDRFVSLEASFSGGTILTKPLVLTGSTLHLNAKADFGTIDIDALDLEGNLVAKADPVSAEGLDLPVRWRQGRLPETRTPLRLRITLENAYLFALWSK
ncbi:MAG TPA: hypothetical protein PLQ89_09945 [Phycisphaerae bacterium]|nr:hypothetical protein [Phycisphaerae bacterium]HOM50465.1 hypothetical protein [Phycisphaerae bacterium]HON66531.1 hypothetical protein [Phycisphaerae bacterium]HOQ86030.1 hypothetical protein [Phycisphaerae bacterium]HPP28166.1 hypothetical protein [Phycisphaerae bacterium]